MSKAKKVNSNKAKYESDEEDKEINIDIVSDEINNVNDEDESDNDLDDYDNVDIEDDLIEDVKQSNKGKNKFLNKKALDDEEEEDEYDEDEDEDDLPSVNSMDYIDYTEDENDIIEYIVPNEKRISSNYLSKLEYSAVIGFRGEQIANGSKIYVDIGSISDPIEIAKKELFNNKFPLSVKRHIGNNKYEIWACNELIKKKYI